MDESPVDVMPHAVLGNVLVLESEECSELEVASDKSDSVSVQSECFFLCQELKHCGSADQ